MNVHKLNLATVQGWNSLESLNVRARYEQYLLQHAHWPLGDDWWEAIAESQERHARLTLKERQNRGVE